MSGGDSNTSGFVAGGSPASPPYTFAGTENWNGSAWTEVNNMNTARYGAGSSGTATLALIFGGATPTTVAITESWNGTSWTEVADLATARTDLADGSNNSTANATLAVSGTTGSYVGTTEEWTVPSSVNNLTVASS